MINRIHALPIVQQCQTLAISRSTACCQPRPVSSADLALMRRINELHLEGPFAGARTLSTMLTCEGRPVGRRRVSTRMKRMETHALYCKPNTSKRYPAHRVDPYLLRPLEMTSSNHLWAADITYIPMTRGFVYLSRS